MAIDSGPRRPIDQNVEAVQSTLKSRFSYVSKARANVWLTTGVTLFIFGLVFSVAVTKNAAPEAPAAGHKFTISGPTQVQAGQKNGYEFSAPGSAGNFPVNWGDGTQAEELAFDQTGQATATHSYVQPGSYTISAQAVSANTNKPRSAALTVEVTSASSGAAMGESLLSISLDPSTPAPHTISAGQSDATFTIVQLTAKQVDITVKTMTVVVQAEDVIHNLGKISIYADATLLGSGRFDADHAKSMRISLGAGITIPADGISQLTLKADVSPRAVGDTVSLGVDSLETKPETSTGGDLPVFGNPQTINASGYLGPPIKQPPAQQ